MLSAIHCRFFRQAFAYSIPIGGLGGLIGFGGGQVCLPLLIQVVGFGAKTPRPLHVVGFDAKSAVPLTLMVSMVTLAFALATLSHAAPLAAFAPHLPEMAGLV